MSTPVSSPVEPNVRRWRLARRLVLVLACLTTLLAVCYTVENWRGRKAWAKCKKELEARGEIVDWAAYIPQPVSDEQNFFKAPKMKEWFAKDSFMAMADSTQSSNEARPFAVALRNPTNVLVAKISVVTPTAPLEAGSREPLLSLTDPRAGEQAAKLLRGSVGPLCFGAKSYLLIARPLDTLKPLQLELKADTAPTAKEIAGLFPSNALTGVTSASDPTRLEVEQLGSNSFRVWLKGPVYDAADYLAWTEPLTSNFDLVRKALERPYARIDCDYSQPFAIAIPNFVRIRDAVQTLSQRAQCELLLGRPEEAWHELSLVHDLSQILGGKPPGKPVTLVGAMINTAIHGLYAEVVKDGLRRHAWHDAQLREIERQLEEARLLEGVLAAFREERAATSRTFETTRRSELVKLLNVNSSSRTWRDELERVFQTVAFTCMPQGWFSQNMALGGRVGQQFLDNVDPTNQVVRPRLVDAGSAGLESGLQHRSPYNFLVAIAVPNFRRALQTVAHNQSLLNEARVACALERYRILRGAYPEDLAALAPEIMPAPPHDVIGGQPLSYRRTGETGYILYSVGWNGKDDGGVTGKSREEGDWVWQLP